MTAFAACRLIEAVEVTVAVTAFATLRLTVAVTSAVVAASVFPTDFVTVAVEVAVADTVLANLASADKVAVEAAEAVTGFSTLLTAEAVTAGRETDSVLVMLRTIDAATAGRVAAISFPTDLEIVAVDVAVAVIVRASLAGAANVADTVAFAVTNLPTLRTIDAVLVPVADTVLPTLLTIVATITGNAAVTSFPTDTW